MKTLKHQRKKGKRETENGKTFHAHNVAQANLKITVHLSIPNANYSYAPKMLNSIFLL